MFILAGAAVPGAAVSCDVTENKTFHECYGAVGKPLFVRLITDTTGYQIEFKSPGNQIMVEFKKDKAVVRLCCFNFINNGTLKLDKAERNYSGQYSLDIFDSNGTSIQKKNVELIIIETGILPVLGALGGIVLLFVMTLALYCYCKNKKDHHASGVNKSGNEELVYADVSASSNKRNEKKKVAKPEEEVVYGEVKV
ncbi:hypothetical protein GN956_G25753 [Arapaima gigas]